MNPRKTTITILAMLSASLALADDFKTINGKEYKDATVSRVEPDGVVVKTKSGISKVYFTELPKEVQERFQYDPVKAAQFASAAQAASAQSNVAAAKTEAKNTQQKALARGPTYRIGGFVFQKTGEGLILNYPDIPLPWPSSFTKTMPDFIFLKGHPGKAKLADGDRVDVIGYETGTYSDGGTTYHAFTFYSR
jgi:hypothetical protein